MKKFCIDIDFVTSVTVRATHYIKKRENETDEEFLFRKLSTDGISSTSLSSEDHPEFAKLRNQLEDEGYILTERQWWNGDRVLKDFYLNNVKFKKGDKFYCAAAMKFTLEHRKK